jgi:hypothetical protein
LRAEFVEPGQRDRIGNLQAEFFDRPVFHEDRSTGRQDRRRA